MKSAKKDTGEVLFTLTLRKGECAWAFVEDGRIGLFGDLDCAKARVLFSLMIRGSRDKQWLQEHLQWAQEQSEELWSEMKALASWFPLSRRFTAQA